MNSRNRYSRGMDTNARVSGLLLLAVLIIGVLLGLIPFSRFHWHLLVSVSKTKTNTFL